MTRDLANLLTGFTYRVGILAALAGLGYAVGAGRTPLVVVFAVLLGVCFAGRAHNDETRQRHPQWSGYA